MAVWRGSQLSHQIADSDTKIYYSYDSDNPLTRGERYYSPITLDKEGTYEITAVAVDAQESRARWHIARYEIKFEAPRCTWRWTLDGGTFWCTDRHYNHST